MPYQSHQSASKNFLTVIFGWVTMCGGTPRFDHYHFRVTICFRKVSILFWQSKQWLHISRSGRFPLIYRYLTHLTTQSVIEFAQDWLSIRTINTTHIGTWPAFSPLSKKICKILRTYSLIVFIFDVCSSNTQ